jgi:hypothetical protein
VHATTATWCQLGLGEPPDARPLYVGKAEVSLVSRDLKTHFRSGRTGQSTVRRTFAALLRTELELHPVPRNAAKPDHPAMYALLPDDDAKLTAWMTELLEIATWTKPIDCTELVAVEVAVIRGWCPPLNIKDNASSPWKPTLSQARRAMADVVRRSGGSIPTAK